MFEKEAQEWVKAHTKIENKESYVELKGPSAIESFEAGAEFGYNKFKEELNHKGLALQFDMDKTIEQNIALKKENAELKEENTELKTKKIPQLERKIASIRGCHSVAVKKLNARIEQVERLKKENAELRQKLRSNYV